MSILGKAANKFNRASEETVRVVDYDAILEMEEEAPVEKPKRQPREKKVREPRPKKESRRKKISDTVEDDRGALTIDDEEDFDSAFTIDKSEPNFYEEKQALWEEQQNSTTGPSEEALQDILDVLQIPSTFTLASDVLIPEDFEDIVFDYQMPEGYETGQVDYFVRRARGSVSELIKLLELRNEHIALLATTIDKLQVDAQNLKFDNQLSAGIGIMPTSDSVELENEVMELKITIQKMKDEQKTSLNEEERRLYEELRDAYSTLAREKEGLEEQVYELKNQVAYLEENAEEMNTSPAELVGYDEETSVFANSEFADAANPLETNEGSLFAHIDDDEEGSTDGFLSNYGENAPPVSPPKPQTPLAAPEAVITIISEDDDEEDELDKLMKDWGN